MNCLSLELSKESAENLLEKPVFLYEEWYQLYMELDKEISNNSHSIKKIIYRTGYTHLKVYICQTWIVFGDWLLSKTYELFFFSGGWERVTIGNKIYGSKTTKKRETLNRNLPKFKTATSWQWAPSFTWIMVDLWCSMESTRR